MSSLFIRADCIITIYDQRNVPPVRNAIRRETNQPDLPTVCVVPGNTSMTSMSINLKFADDTKIMAPVSNQEQITELQSGSGKCVSLSREMANGI